MVAILVVVAVVLLIVFSNKKRWKEQDESFDAFVNDLAHNTVKRIDEALDKAQRIAEENGVDLNEHRKKQ